MECSPAGRVGLVGSKWSDLQDVLYVTLAVEQTLNAELQTGDALHQLTQPLLRVAPSIRVDFL